jgi:hypothetical protein
MTKNTKTKNKNKKKKKKKISGYYFDGKKLIVLYETHKTF